MPIKRIHVTYTEGGPLAVDPLDVTLEAGDQIQWDFHNLPPYTLAFIFFPDNEAQALGQTFGPFQFLEPSSSTVMGIGSTGQQRDYPYYAMVLNQDRALATSAGASARIRNAAPKDSSPDALIRYDAAAGSFQVTPSVLRLERDRTANWYITGIPLDHFVTFRFEDFLASPSETAFHSFSLSRGFHDAWVANGAGFLSDPLDSDLIPTRVNYRVTLRDASGTVVATHDPVIEPLESPPG